MEILSIAKLVWDALQPFLAPVLLTFISILGLLKETKWYDRRTHRHRLVIRTLLVLMILYGGWSSYAGFVSNRVLMALLTDAKQRPQLRLFLNDSPISNHSVVTVLPVAGTYLWSFTCYNDGPVSAYDVRLMLALPPPQGLYSFGPEWRQGYGFNLPNADPISATNNLIYWAAVADPIHPHMGSKLSTVSLTKTNEKFVAYGLHAIIYAKGISTTAVTFTVRFGNEH